MQRTTGAGRGRRGPDIHWRHRMPRNKICVTETVVVNHRGSHISIRREPLGSDTGEAVTNRSFISPTDSSDRK